MATSTIKQPIAYAKGLDTMQQLKDLLAAHPRDDWNTTIRYFGADVLNTLFGLSLTHGATGWIFRHDMYTVSIFVVDQSSEWMGTVMYNIQSDSVSHVKKWT